jgi:hypothetical protein
MVLGAAGCLDAPPRAGDAGDGEGADGGGADGGERDPDAGACPTIVSSGFDSLEWTPAAPPGSFVNRSASWVEVRATPSTDIYVSADLHTVTRASIEDSTLTVTVDGPIVSVSGDVGIAWANRATDDSYQLELVDSQLRARRTAGSPEEMEVCDPDCPDYSFTEHARLRLLEQGGTVHYQAASETGAWIDIGTAPATALEYNVFLYASATGPGSGELNVIDLEWMACGE